MNRKPEILIGEIDIQPGESRSAISDLPIVTVPVFNVCDKEYRLTNETYHWLNQNVGWQNPSVKIACWDFILAESRTGLATFRFIDEKKATMFKLFFS